MGGSLNKLKKKPPDDKPPKNPNDEWRKPNLSKSKSVLGGGGGNTGNAKLNAAASEKVKSDLKGLRIQPGDKIVS